ncbi:kinase-like domain-containing protein [Polychytrium aggregatum]|uniref:kinase-like domain-containing protein n=1 Tax=Polychytrium aggregatum TaxID=110093 RepID=UPI0022FE31B2|nr:kinase-like domain-containing protein [Polychytrium aggregatum]KAI9204233.1 kinase-like domain-containing protein [Polychytrium aggregatum]
MVLPTIHRALNTTDGCAVAIKRISMRNLPQDRITMLMEEVTLLSHLMHTNIVTYYGYLNTEDHINIALELVDNGSLLKLLKTHGKFKENLVCIYTMQILQGLIYLHEKNVVHCDLKAANILITKDGVVKLTDFGVSKQLAPIPEAISTDASVPKNEIVGTPHWMAPEVILQQGVTKSSDIWSLGCTIIELLTGKPPNHEMPICSVLYRAMTNDLSIPIPEDISGDLSNFLSLCLQYNPQRRPTAAMLINHAWIVSRKPLSRRSSAASHRSEEPLSPFYRANSMINFPRPVSSFSSGVDNRLSFAASIQSFPKYVPSPRPDVQKSAATRRYEELLRQSKPRSPLSPPPEQPLDMMTGIQRDPSSGQSMSPSPYREALEDEIERELRELVRMKQQVHVQYAGLSSPIERPSMGQTDSPLMTPVSSGRLGSGSNYRNETLSSPSSIIVNMGGRNWSGYLNNPPPNL